MDGVAVSVTSGVSDGIGVSVSVGNSTRVGNAAVSVCCRQAVDSKMSASPMHKDFNFTMSHPSSIISKIMISI